MQRLFLLLSACAVALAACSKNDAAPAAAAPTVAGEAPGAAPAPAAVDFAVVAAAAVAAPSRLAADRAEDERRKPAAALEFFQAGPGMTVFEIEAGAGWYTEILSHAVGESGAVVMQNPEGFRAFVGEQIDARLAGGRLANVRQSLSNFDALDAPSGSVDVATWVQGPHELYYTPSEGVSLGDPAKSYAEIYRILKPGGVFAVIDHSAVAGAPETVGNELHRVDRATVVAMAETAGFTLEAESAFLANPEDPRTITVFDPAIRGRTDQFALRFRKPT
ncbi:MAG: methyltransferase domain-containing protein [Parvularculaceae bacterium]|nr:methyltransferase domain-containing protein [Parvularculaceae bacterium]